MSTTIEAMMQDKKALQSGTSHYFGQNFAQAFEIQFLNKENTLDYAYTTSWGLSTRMIGAIIMTHGDDQGLIMPPKIAPIQVVIVPIYKTDEEKSKVMEVADKVFFELKSAGIRIKMDDRDGVTPGFKYNDWEMRGVPLRLEIGPKDVEKDSVALARRDKPGREGKSFSSQTGLASTVSLLAVTTNSCPSRTAIKPLDVSSVRQIISSPFCRRRRRVFSGLSVSSLRNSFRNLFSFLARERSRYSRARS